MSKEEIETDDDSEIGSTPRWMAGTVMLVAVAGFTGLAYYAYHAGTRSIKEDELLLVEADSGPVKEAPADPGGMKFPHQDKTIFDAISGAPKGQTAEKVAPAPEQPVAETAKPWVNDKLAEAAPADAPVKEALMEKPAPVETATAPASASASAIESKLNAMAPASGDATEAKPAEAPVTVSEVPVATDTQQAEEKPEAKQGEKVDLKPPAAEKIEKAVEKKIADKKEKAKAKAAASAPSSGGKGTVQLGSYRSEAEAKAAWKKIQGKHGALSGSSMDVQRADLGQKGVYFRLRAAVANAKEVCGKLTAKGQACMVVKG